MEDVDMEDCHEDDEGEAAVLVGGRGGFHDWQQEVLAHHQGGFEHHHHHDDDVDDDDDDVMEWDAEVVEAALHSLSALRRDPSLTPSDAADDDESAVPSGPASTLLHSRKRETDSLLNTPDAMLLSPDGAVMLATTTEGSQVATRLPIPPLLPLDGTSAPYYVAVTVVPDTNVLVQRGGASLRMLLERFRSKKMLLRYHHHRDAADADAADEAMMVMVRVRVAVPRKVVQELDGLKARRGGTAGEGGGGGGGCAGGRQSEVAQLAQSVNRAIMRRLEEQEREQQREAASQLRQTEGGVGEENGNDNDNGEERRGRGQGRRQKEGELASLVVQGPADAGKMRVQMRSEGVGVGGGGGGGGGDEEIVYFCQARRRRGEMVVMLTMDVNAAVTARAVASEDDVPVAVFDPLRDMPADAATLWDAARGFYYSAAAAADLASRRDEGRLQTVDVAVQQQQQQRHFIQMQQMQNQFTSTRQHHRETVPAEVASPPPQVPVAAKASTVVAGQTTSSENTRSRGGDDALQRSSRSSSTTTATTTTAAAAAAALAEMSNEARVLAVLDSFDAAMPIAVETMLRDELGDMWAAAVRHDAEDIDSFTPDAAFAAMKNNHMSLTAASHRGRGRGREGRAAMETLGAARRQRERGSTDAFADRFRALEVIAAVREILACCPGDLTEVRTASVTADTARMALMKAPGK